MEKSIIDSPWKRNCKQIKSNYFLIQSMTIKEVEMNERDKAVLANGDIGQG